MKHERVSLVDGKDMYVRLPKNLDDMAKMIVFLPKELAGMTLKIEAIRSCRHEIPFEKWTIEASGEAVVMTYYGDDEYWQPQEDVRIAVEGNPDCDYEECNAECHVVSCPVYQGLESDAPIEIHYVKSDKVV